MSHFGPRLPSARTPFGHRNIMQIEINDPKEGDYFSIEKSGEDWPIVICDEEIIQTFFTHLPRPDTARRADGTWEKPYKAGGFLISERSVPAINMGTLEFMWAPTKGLEPIDIDMGRAIRSSTTNRSLAKAWSEYIDQYKGGRIFAWKDLDYWKKKLHAQHPDRTATGGAKKGKLPVGKVYRGLKRKGTPEVKYPPGYRNEALDDEEPEDLFLPQGNPAGPKIKRESINSFSSEEMDALYDDADPPYPTFSQSSKRSKVDSSGRFSMRPLTPLAAGPGKLVTPRPSVPRGTPYQSINKNIDVNDPDTVIIYVDNPHKRFKVQRRRLDASPPLSKLLTHHPENGWYIMSPLLSSIDANDFRPVGEYIDRREYHPNILDDGTVHVRFEGDLSPENVRQEVLRCGTIYQLAQMLEMPGLQHLVFRKLKALARTPTKEMLVVIESVFQVGSLEVREFLTRHVAEHYWDLVLAETERMVEVMSANGELAKGVFGILSRGDDKVKMEEVVKKEKEKEEKEEEEEEEGEEEVLTENKEGAKDEEGKRAETNDKGSKSSQSTSHSDSDSDIPNPSAIPVARASSVTTAAAKPHENGPNNNEGGLSQAEEDMVKMALLRSDEEEKSEEEDDWVQLVQKQSDLFEAF